MERVIIIGLWEILGSKGFSVSSTLKIHFNIGSDHFLERYEKSLHLTKWSNKEDMAKSFLREFDLSTSKENIEFVIDTIIKGVEDAILHEDTTYFLQTLKSHRFKLVLFSNTTIFESKIIDKWNIKHFFDYIIFPFETQLLKPSVESFRNIMKIYNISSKNCICIDNEKRVLKVANNLGLKTIVFEKGKDANYYLRKLIKK